jgi:hypothetical protein
VATPVLVMSQKERDHLTVIKQLSDGRCSVSEAAERLSVSRRHIFRLLARYQASGDAGLVHRLRGRPSNRGYSAKLKKRVTSLYWQPEYRDYGPTLFAEVLSEAHKIRIDHETVRRWLMGKGGTNVQRKKRPHRTKRPRRSAKGELVQFDGSEHDWFEGRGPACTLLHLIDDATGEVYMQFAPSENTQDCMRTFWAYVRRRGLPESIYTDRGSVFYEENHGRLTDFARAMATLHVQMIYANSPQAKGRVERGNRTHQDRLVKALRRAEISTIAEANRFLHRRYLEAHNKRFAVQQTAASLPDVHRKVDPALDLRQVFCLQTERCLRHDYCITLEATFVQILKGPYALPRPRSYLTVRRYLDGTLHIFSAENNEELRFKILEEKPKASPFPATIVHPKANHPWRINHPIGKAKRGR